ncbi:diaminopimelate decarboxylase, partial [Streptomyces sp. TRM76130]|nr:diaminopimelate decarboxylase [Streptomyces sp. TRM76130]
MGEDTGTATGHGRTDGDDDGMRRARRRDRAVRAAVEQGLLGSGTPLLALLDVTGIRESAAALRAA